jgi:hypothetical protein
MRGRIVGFLAATHASTCAALGCHSFGAFGPVDEEPTDAAAPDGSPSDGSAAEAAQGPADWSCLGSSGPPPSLPAAVDVTLDTIDVFRPIVTAGATGGSDLQLVAATPLAGVSVQACAPLDPECASPQTPPADSDDAGIARLTLPSDFAGTLRLERPDLLPGTIYLGRFVESAPSFPIPGINAQTAQVFGMHYGVTLGETADAGVGQLFVFVYDCRDRRAPGVTFAFTPTASSTVAFYNDTGTVISIAATQTDTIGAGGAFNIPVGEITVTATIAGRPFRSTRVFVESGGATLLLLRARTQP